MLEMAEDWTILEEDGVTVEHYTSPGGEKLRLLIMVPEAAEDGASRPCLLFIHGGGFTGGSAEMLLPQCRYFRKRGYVCVSADYRLLAREEETPAAGGFALEDSIADCKAALRYVRKNAGRWKADPHRIALVGESAGGYLACAVTALSALEAPGADRSVSCVPDLLVAYNPITQLLGRWKMSVRQAALCGADDPAGRWLARHHRARSLSPLCHLTAQHPAALVIHGLEDTVVPPEDGVEYAEQLRRLGVNTRLELLPDSKHAFALCKYTASDEEIVRTLELTADFLSSQWK